MSEGEEQRFQFPNWLEPLPDAGEQRELDRWAIEGRGIPSLELMERAGRGLAELVSERAPEGRIVVVCGKGNNGGDGLVAARVLREQGREVRVLALANPEEFSGDARANLERLPGRPPSPFEFYRLTGATTIIDAILGTGFTGVPREPAASAIEAINAANTEVVACDIPSGVNGSTGEVEGVAVRAAATATFHAAKPGLWIAPGKAHAGEVRVIDIGIPAGGPGAPQIGLIDRAVLELVPRRAGDSTKFSAGELLVCGGSIGLTGAPCLASEAAMRAGAGYVTALVPESLDPIFEVRLLEVMTVPVADEEGSLTLAAGEAVLERSRRAGALVLGPGLGRTPGALQLARSLARNASLPMVLDADGLSAHAGRLDSLAGRPAATVLTPHAGELARLLGMNSSQISAHRLERVRAASRAAEAIVLLKGDDTLVARPDGLVAVSPGGSPALATAGTGDVLSGVIGAMLAKRVEPFAAACAAVIVHAAAGRLAAREVGDECVIASDVIARLPAALRDPGA